MAETTTKPSKDEVGWLFVQAHDFVNDKCLGMLTVRKLFYTKKSSLVNGIEGEQVKLSQGQQEIHDKISELGFNDCKVLVSNVDSQASAEGGILVQVLGEMSNNGQPSQKFAQTFFLAPQEKGYYVLNDIFRYLKDEDIESEFDAGEDLEETKAQDVSAKAALPEATKLSHGHEAVKAPVATESSSRVIVPEVTVNGTPSAVADLEEAAAALAPDAAVTAPVEEEVVPSPAQTPAEVEKAASAPAAESKAVEAIAELPAAKPEAPKGPMSWAARAAASKAAAPKPPAAASPKPAAPVAVPEAVESKPQSPAVVNGTEVAKSAFLKNVTAGMQEGEIKSVLAKFGSIRAVEINRQKNCGFADFNDVVSCQAAIKQNKVTVNGEVMLVEERRRDLMNKSKFQNREGQRYDNARGGRGGARGGSARGRGGKQQTNTKA